MIKNIIEVAIKSNIINYLDLKRNLSSVKCGLTNNPCNLCQLYDFKNKFCEYQYLEHVCYTIEDLILLIYLFSKKEKEQFKINLKLIHPQVNIEEIFQDNEDEIDDNKIKIYIERELKKLFNVSDDELASDEEDVNYIHDVIDIHDKINEEEKDKNQLDKIVENEIEKDIYNQNELIELVNQNENKNDELIIDTDFNEKSYDKKIIFTKIKEILLKTGKLKLYDINSEEFHRIKNILSMTTIGKIMIKLSEIGFENISKEDIDYLFPIATYIDIIKDYLYSKSRDKINKEDIFIIIDYISNYKEYSNINNFPHTYHLSERDIAKIIEAHSYITKDDYIFKWNKERLEEYSKEIDPFKKLTISHNFLYTIRKFKPNVLTNKSQIIQAFVLYELLKEVSIYMMSRVILVDIEKREYFINLITNLYYLFDYYTIKPYIVYIISKEKVFKVESVDINNEEQKGISIVQIKPEIVDEIEQNMLYDEKITLL